MQKRITIGIDPDVDKNGMAIFNHEDSQLSLYEFDLSDLFMQLLKHKAICQKNKVELTVRLEAGHRVKRTWQARTVGTIKNVGRNNEIGAQSAYQKPTARRQKLTHNHPLASQNATNCPA